MAGSYPSQLNPGAYVSTTELLDPASINEINVNADEFKDFLNALTRVINDINLLLNLKDTGYYTLEEFLNGQLFFPNPTLTSSTSAAPIFRNVFRKVISCGTMPNNTTSSIPHNIDINSGYTFTRIYGCTSIPGSTFVPLPTSDIFLRVDTTDILIRTTNANYINYTTTYVIVEYIKS